MSVNKALLVASIGIFLSHTHPPNIIIDDATAVNFQYQVTASRSA
jgi:hypothetical protein